MNALSKLKSSLASQIAKSPRLKRLLAGCSFIVVAVLVSFSIFATAPKAVPQGSQEIAWPVSILSIEPGDLAPIFSSYGKVEANNIAMLRTDVVAEIVSVFVKEGQWVSKGDVLIELRKDELSLRVADQQADLMQKQAILTSIETEYRLLQNATSSFESVYQLSQKKLDRYQDLLKKKMISQSVLDEVVQQTSQQTIAYQIHTRQLANFPSQIAQQKAQIARVSSQLEQAKINFGKTEILAPFSGPILEVSAAVGGYTSFSVPLVKLADARAFEIRAPLANVYIDRFRQYLAQDKDVHASATINNNQYSLRLSRLSSNVKPGNSGLDAFFEIEDTSAAELPEIGRVVDMKVVLPIESDAIALPIQSLYENSRIYRIDNNRLEAINVERIGDYETPDGQYRVLVRSTALQSGEQIITTQLPRAISGLLVDPIDAVITAKL